MLAFAMVGRQAQSGKLGADSVWLWGRLILGYQKALNLALLAHGISAFAYGPY